MLFNSYYFIIIFLPLTLFLYYGSHRFGFHRLSLVIITIASFVFYAFDNVYYIGLLAGSIALNWIFACLMNRVINNKVILTLGILSNLAIIFYFKYLDFFLGNVNFFFGSSFSMRHILLPMGISFYTFQQISYLIDTYRGETKEYSFIEYAAFVSFFPQLVAGPIVLHSELIPQYRDSSRWRINEGRFAGGLYAFAIGLSKKVLIADVFGRAVNWAWADIPARSSLEWMLAMFFYTFQMYFDFSGYCDMAIGLAGMFNLEFPINFNSPYKACSINDHWKRWHMTLTRFLTRYVYIPLGGSKKGKVRTYINILIVFFVSGLWHGANWTYVIWAMAHGILQVLNRMFHKAWDKVPKFVAWTITFLFVNVFFIMFYAPSVSDALTVWKQIFSFNSFGVSKEMASLFVNEEIDMVLGLIGLGGLSTGFISWYMIAYLLLAFFICMCCKNVHEEAFKPTIPKAVFSSIVMLWAVLSLTGISTFLYSNF